MAEFSTPTQQNLNDLYGAWNPAAYYKGYENQGIADLYRQEAMKQAQEATRKASLDNQFLEQDNPNRVQERVLTNQGKVLLNEGQGYLNTTRRLESERASANQQNLLNEDQRKAALSLTEDEMKAFDNHVGMLLRSNDPKEQAQGAKMQQLIPAFQAERRKHADALAIQQEQSRSHIEGAKLGLEGVKYTADKRLEGAQARVTKGAASIEQQIRQGKMSFEQAATAFHGAAQFETDPEVQAKYTALAGQYEQLARNKAEAAGQGKLDLNGATGMAVKNNPPVLAGGGQPAPAATKPQHSLADVRKLYPNVSDADLKAAYKQKFNQDLQ